MRCIAVTVVLFASLVRVSPAQSTPALRGHIERIKVHGKSLEGNLEGDSPDRDVSIYLPPSYRTSPGRRYPVVYVLHGFTDRDDMWFGLVPHFVNLPRSMEAALKSDSAREMILVMPNAYTRYGGSFYGSSEATGDWETFVTRELVTYIDSHYRTLATRASRGLAGHSMGGYGAIRLAMKYPEVYSAVYAMSACCLYQDTPALASVQQADSVQSDEDFKKAGFFTQVLLAEGAAWSASAKGPRFLNLPYKDGALQPLVVAEWNANMPAAMLGQYAANLKTIHFIALDVGLQDFLLGTDQGMDQLLTSQSVPHTFETYQGTHTSGIGERLETKVLPFFSRHLSFGKAP
ncbi:MAG: alpha/beta hydrolase [Gemmatimonadales bacterium]